MTMTGSFSKDALAKFNAMCAEGVDFGEGPTYDFAMCLMTNGDVYGVEPGEACEKGKPISDEMGKKLKAKKKSKESPAAKMAILKKAFIAKMGREMSKEELAKAAWMANKGK
jgi:hypothetical protein